MKNIAVGIDFSDAKEAVLKSASELAKALDATLHIIHVVAPEPSLVGFSGYAYPGPDERAEELAAEQDEMQKMIDALRADGIDAQGYMKTDETVGGLIGFAEHREASMIIIGTHSRNLLSRVLMGSVAEGVVRKSKLPVLVVPVRDEEAGD